MILHALHVDVCAPNGARALLAIIDPGNLRSWHCTSAGAPACSVEVRGGSLEVMDSASCTWTLDD